MLWWQTGVVYQIYPRSFYDASGDGVGDLAGIIDKLAYLEDLGVDAIWISPFYPSPMADFGYDISNFIDVDPLFGDLATFDRLIAEAHARNIRVIVDFVPSHSSDQHPWFLESRASRDNPRRDFYIWGDAKPDGSPPNNWLSVFGGSAWEWDAKTQQYYLHSFLTAQPDLNWRNPAVKTAMFDALRFWLDRGVDGFRLDTVLRMMKDPELRDNPLNERQALQMHRPMGDYDSQVHIHDAAHPDIHGLFRELRQLLDSYESARPRVAIAELHVYDLGRWSSYYGVDLDEFHLPFNFALLNTPWKAGSVGELVAGIEAAVPPGGWPNYVLGNHDEHRVATRVGPEQARVAMMMLLTLRGTPTLYNGDELGMTDVPIPPERVQDPWGKQVPGLSLGRDPARTPVQWSEEPNAGFCPPGVEPWLPVAEDYRQVNVAVQSRDRRSTLALTRALLRLRRAIPALHAGSHETVADVPDDCLVYIREWEGKRYLIALNFGESAQVLSLPGRGRIVLSTGLDREGTAELGRFELRPHEGCVIAMD